MKVRTGLYFLALIVLNLQAQTPEFFPYESDRMNSKGERTVDPEEVAKARTSPECRPAELEPGKWGPKSEDFQLSVRTAETIFAHGEPIIATVIVRNVGSRIRSYKMTVPDIKSEVKVLDSDNMPVRKKATGRSRFEEKLNGVVNDFKVYEIRPGFQRKYAVDLSKDFDLATPGTYTVSISRIVRKSNGPGEGKVRSNTLRITVR